MASIVIADNIRVKAGVGSVINTKHTGITKRPTETRSHLDEITAEDIAKSTKKESPIVNSSFLDQGSNK